ncbi:MAG: hypothetical protein JW847_07705 [Candidatus Omnitrophica bacterium]|nr:hypothetical protein [Candidatus Omnitrophota bacterium]
MAKFPFGPPVKKEFYLREGFDDQIDLFKPVREVLGICDELNIQCVNPLEELKTMGLNAIIAGDDHPSVKGHRIISEVLLKNIYLES